MPGFTSFLIAALAALALLPGCAGMAPERGSATATQPLSGTAEASHAPYGMVQIAPHIFVEPGKHALSTDRLLNIVEKARVRTTYFYGELLAQPDILLCSTMECYRRFGGAGLGYALGSRVIISPQGMRAAIVSHELSHVELAVRLGGRQEILDKIPQWFDEGTAVMVSLAYEFSDEAWLEASHDGKIAPPLNQLASRDDWIDVTGINGRHMQRSYGTARQEVARWYDKVGKDGLYRLISALNANADFQTAYRDIETASPPILAARH